MSASLSAFQPAHEIAAQIRAGKLSPVDLVTAVLARIDASQPTLNAYITVCHTEALAAAKAAEAAVRRGDELGPLHGVPVSVKDIINTKDIRTTWGSRLMADNVPDNDAVAVSRLKAAGAIILGKTTTPEFAHKLLTDAPLFGVTRNPWDLDHSPGGSSGGSAVAVAAGLGPLALATDAGASTRLPAACTAILGLKPTLGIIPHNQVPEAFNNFIHLGLMARNVRDLALMLDVLAGPHPSDPHSLAAPLPGARERLADSLDVKGKRIAWRPLLGNEVLDDEVRTLCEEALHALAEQGAKVEQVDEPFENSDSAWRVLQQSNWAARFYDKLDEVRDRMDPSFVEGIRVGGSYTGQQVTKAGYRRTQIFRAVQQWFARFDFVVTPTAARPPLPVSQRALDPITINGRTVGDMRQAYAPYLNTIDLSGHPAVSVPCGWTKAGLPVGLQIIGPWYADAEILRLAAVFEQIRPWASRIPPHAPA
ncbi:MAG TPA: amidase [Alphaproteobacteria bacterium]|nr:amidase [Alphaproteobacteria bacterium]